MADHGEEPSIGFGAESWLPTGRRRSTFTAAVVETTVPDTFGLSASPAPSGPPQLDALPPAPTRHSLDNAELVRTIDADPRVPGSILGAIDKLEAEMRLRQHEAAQFSVWQTTMESIGTPEALNSISDVRQTFTGVIDVVPPAVVAHTLAANTEQQNGDQHHGGPYDLRLAGAPPEAAAVYAFAPPKHPPVATSGLVVVPTELTDEHRFADTQPITIRRPVLETSGSEPTQVERRIGRAARLFWLWFPTNSSVLSVAFGAALFSLGMSLRQAVVAAFVGVALSFLPLGLGTLAGKWSGQPTMVASRATFGLVGNVIPALLAVITRIFWGAVLLWLIAVSVARILVGAGLNGSFSELQITVFTMAVGFLIALAVAAFGYGVFARIQSVLSIVAALLVIGLIVVTWPSINISKALTVGDGPWILVVTGVVLVFSFVGLVWMSCSGDLARYQGPSSSGAAAMLWAPFGATLPAFVLMAYGALLAASGSGLARGLTTHPLDTIAQMLPHGYPIPLIAASVLSLLSGVVLSMCSGGFALQAAGLRVSRAWSTVIIGVALFSLAVLLSFTVIGSVVPVFRELATSLAVPVAAWAGIFSAEMIIRRRRFDTASLLQRGGVYPAVNWINLSMLVVATAVGFGLTTASLGWLSWQGYLFGFFGLSLQSDVAGTDIGVLVALALGLVVTFATAVPGIRKQERDRAVAF